MTVDDANLTVQVQGISVSIVKDMAIGRKSVAIEGKTVIEEVHHVTTEEEAQVMITADGQDHHIDQQEEEGAEVEAAHEDETMEGQKNLRKDVALFARKEATSSETALTSSTEEEIVSKEDEVETVTCAVEVIETQEAGPLLVDMVATETVEDPDKKVALLLVKEITLTDLLLHPVDMLHVLLADLEAINESSSFSEFCF